jgi:DNA repair protein RecO (recombination protein O)
MVYHWTVARNRITDGIILKNTRFGEIHKSVSLLSPEYGVLNAIAHGAYKGKSKLGGVTEVFAHLRVYLYHDPVKGSYKITDAEPLAIYERLRHDLVKFYIASLWAEAVIRTYAGGGEYASTFSLLRHAMALLDRCPAERNDSVLSLFLYRYIENLGYLPDLTVCEGCGSPLGENEPWFLAGDGTARCVRCGREGQPVLTPGARRYLAYVSTRRLADALKVDLDKKSLKSLKNALIAIMQHIIGGPLNSLRGSGGIL